MMISKIPTISLKKLNINKKYKTWIFLIFVFVSVALISKIWLTLVTIFGLYLLSIMYIVFRKIKLYSVYVRKTTIDKFNTNSRNTNVI